MRKRLIDLVYLLALALFVFAIPPTFHGDEPMQIYMSSDYATAFLDHDPSALITAPPYSIDSDAYLRLINGTINRYAIGLSWQIAGLSARDLPPRPGWDWGLDYTTNVNTGHMPPALLLAVGRFSSTLFLALSVVVMFALGWQFARPHNRLMAYFVSGLYALNPVILLNGRRALQEGSTLFFGLLTILIASLISQRLVQSRRGDSQPLSSNSMKSVALWLALIVAAGLTLASKYTGIVFVGGALGWIFLAEVFHTRGRALLLTTLRLIGAGLLSALLFIALSPALWSDPPARLLDSLHEREALLNIQVASDSNAPMSLPERLREIVVQPFMTAPQQYEVAFWVNFKAVTDDIARYMSSPLSGFQFGLIIGGALMLLAATGIGFSLVRDWRVGLFAWLGLTVASLLANPLPWQRYYLGWIPLVTLLTGIGLLGLMQRFVWKPEQPRELSHMPPQNS